jgi:predicted enzyme related to lactoylglutathione lyase
MADLLFSGVATRDLSSALPWYEALLGRPADVIVNDREVMWEICHGGWLYLVEDAGRAGHALVSIAVPDLDRTVAEMVDRGIDKPAVETIPGAGRKAPVVDPEGNTVTFIDVTADGAAHSSPEKRSQAD